MHWIQRHLTGNSDYPGFANWTAELMEAALKDPNQTFNLDESLQLLSHSMDHQQYDFVAHTIDLMANFYHRYEIQNFGSISRYHTWEPQNSAVVNLLLRAGFPAEKLSPHAKKFFAIGCAPVDTEPGYIAEWLGGAKVVQKK